MAITATKTLISAASNKSITGNKEITGNKKNYFKIWGTILIKLLEPLHTLYLASIVSCFSFRRLKKNKIMELAGIKLVVMANCWTKAPLFLLNKTTYCKK